MKNYPLWKSLLVVIVIFLGIIFSIPSILYKEDSSNWFLNNKINLGLDLQGGSYLLLEVDSAPVVKQKLQNKLILLRKNLKKQKIKYQNLNLSNEKIIFKIDPIFELIFYGIELDSECHCNIIYNPIATVQIIAHFFQFIVCFDDVL